MSGRSHKEEKRGLIQQFFSPKPVEKKGPTTVQEPTSHSLGQGTVQKAGAAARARKSQLDREIDKQTGAE